jgi:hypothetical protein
MKIKGLALEVAIPRSLVGTVFAIIVACTVISARSPAFAQTNPSKELAIIPPDKDSDLKFYRSDGKIERGVEALEHMTSDAKSCCLDRRKPIFCDG